MNYIVVDLEWNYPADRTEMRTDPFPFDSEIIEIGAVKLNERFERADELRLFVRPTFYPVLTAKVAQLTKITKAQLERADAFPEACRVFFDWCGEECALMTWGPTDIPVFMDNMLMHGISLAGFPDSYDLQRMFGHEIMRDDRQWALDKIMDMLKLHADRSHDALNDARNTVLAANYMNLGDILEEYRCHYVNYEEDRLSGLVEGRIFAGGYPEALKVPEITSFVCPYTGETLTATDWAMDTQGPIGYARSSENDEYLVSLGIHHEDTRVRVGRVIQEMSDDLWDHYNDRLEQNPIIT